MHQRALLERRDVGRRTVDGKALSDLLTERIEQQKLVFVRIGEQEIASVGLHMPRKKTKHHSMIESILGFEKRKSIDIVETTVLGEQCKTLWGAFEHLLHTALESGQWQFSQGFDGLCGLCRDRIQREKSSRCVKGQEVGLLLVCKQADALDLEVHVLCRETQLPKHKKTSGYSILEKLQLRQRSILAMQQIKRVVVEFAVADIVFERDISDRL